MRLLSLVAFAIVVVVNYLAAVGWINNTDTGAVSDRYANQLTPAGYAFAIWSLIYLGLGAFAIFQAATPKAKSPSLGAVRTAFVVTCALNAAWLFAWHYDLIPLTLLLMTGLLATLTYISAKLRETAKTAEVILVKAPFNLYFGWITVATILNATIFFVYIGFNSDSPYGALFGVLLIAAATAIGTLLRFRFNAFLYPMAIAWGVTAIAVKQSGNTAIVVAAAVSVVILLFVALWGAVKD